MIYLNHITLGTGHLRRSPRHEVTDGTLSVLVPLLQSAVAAGAPTPLALGGLDHFGIRATAEGGALLVTLLAPVGPHTQGRPHRGETVPLVTVGIAQRSRHGTDLWAQMVAQFGAAPGLQKPAEPWCAVELHPSALLYQGDISWLGDFERCIAWAWITRRPALGSADDA